MPRIFLTVSPAAAANLRAGDRIVSIDGVSALHFSGVGFERANAALSRTITYVVQRESERHAVTFVLGADPLPALSRTTFPNIVARASHRTSARRE